MTNRPYTYVQSPFDVVEVKDSTHGTLWEIRKQGEPIYPSRQFTTRAQAFMALGILEMLYENRVDCVEIDPIEYERLLITNNLLITGKKWVTE